MTTHNDIYFLQKLALRPFNKSFSQKQLIESIKEMSSGEKNQLMSFIIANSLGPLWIETFGGNKIEKLWSKDWAQKLKNQNKSLIAHYIGQLVTIRTVTEILEKYAIPHAIFKGAHTRELVYNTPATRPSVDIDILISDKHKEKVVKLLTNGGFTLQTKLKNLTHEASLINKLSQVDLHWHILRPGRVPRSLTEDLLNNREKQKGYWTLNSEENLFILLVHPVFTKYVSTTQTGLIRFVDLIYWLNTQSIEWDRVSDLLKKTGLSSAAWITLEYLNILTGVTPPESFLKQITPPGIKKWYLSKWIHQDIPGKFSNTPAIPKLFFTLLAHDSLAHVFQFIQTLTSDKLRKHHQFDIK
jgi:hypothetical protein